MGRMCINLEIEIPTQTRYLGLIGNIGEQLAKDLNEYSGDHDLFAYNLNLVLTESISNAIKYAGNEGKALRVCIKIDGGVLNIQVHDKGQGFNLGELPCGGPEDELCERGRGIAIIRTLMDSVDYRKTQDGNVLEMIKKIA